MRHPLADMEPVEQPPDDGLPDPMRMAYTILIQRQQIQHLAKKLQQVGTQLERSQRTEWMMAAIYLVALVLGWVVF